MVGFTSNEAENNWNYIGFIDRATEIVEKNIGFTNNEAEKNWKTIGFIIKPAPGNRATGNELPIRWSTRLG